MIMKNSFISFLVLIMILFLFSCAKQYHNIKTSELVYSDVYVNNGVILEYSYNVLELSGNKKYNSRADANCFQLVAVRLTNTTERKINIGRDIEFFELEGKVKFANPSEISSHVKQYPLLNLLYLPLLAIPIKIHNGKEEKVYRIGALFSVPMIYNMVISKAANLDFEKDLNRNYILNRDIEVGQSISGVIGYYSCRKKNIRIEVKKFD